MIKCFTMVTMLVGSSFAWADRAARSDGLVRVAAETNGVVRTIFVEVDQRVRKGDALIAIEPEGAEARISVARSNLRNAEIGHEAARTNLLALQQRIELGEVVHGLETAQSHAREVETARAGALAELARIHREFRARTLYAPADGRVIGLPAAGGALVSADDTVVEIDVSLP